MKQVALALVLLFLAGCSSEPLAPSMSSVMSSCESRSNFSSYVRCIKNDYTRDPGASTVKSLYARLAAIDEDFQNGSLSEVKARAEAYKAYDETVEAGNRAQRAADAAYAASYTPYTPYQAPATSTYQRPDHDYCRMGTRRIC